MEKYINNIPSNSGFIIGFASSTSIKDIKEKPIKSFFFGSLNGMVVSLVTNLVGKTMPSFGKVIFGGVLCAIAGKKYYDEIYNNKK